jgi:hypothetical protein
MEKGHELGYFGNIWVRQNVLKQKGDFAGGHYHLFDHVSLLAQGTVEVEVDGHPPKQFVAPTFIVIKKEHRHKFTAVTDNVLWYCVFAIRNEDGDLTDIYPDTSSPFFINDVSETYWENRKKLENLSIDIDIQPFPSWSFDDNQHKWVPPKPYPVNGKLYEWDEDSLCWKLIIKEKHD